jgi:hypothetical protein
VIHESENIDSSEVGRTAAFKIPTGSKQPQPGKPQEYTAKELELWRNPMGSLASSPCLVGDVMYEVTGVGELACINADSGKILWRQKLGVEQRQSSPFYADGKLYIAFYTAAQGGETATQGTEGGGNGELFVIKPGAKGGEILSRTILDGRCYGSPIGYNGKVYLQTDKKLYAFGKKGPNPGAKNVVFQDDWANAPKVGEAAKLQVIPNEVLLEPGEKIAVRVRVLDAAGLTVQENVDIKDVKFDTYIPPTALVKATMKGSFNEKGELTADQSTVASAGAFQATLQVGDKTITGTMRGRVQMAPPDQRRLRAIRTEGNDGAGNWPATARNAASGRDAWANELERFRASDGICVSSASVECRPFPF